MRYEVRDWLMDGLINWSIAWMADRLGLDAKCYPFLWNSPSEKPYKNCFLSNVFVCEGKLPIHLHVFHWSWYLWFWCQLVGSFKNRASSTKSLSKYNEWEKSKLSKVLQQEKHEPSLKKKILCFDWYDPLLIRTWRYSFRFWRSLKVPRPVGQLPRLERTACFDWIFLLLCCFASWLSWLVTSLIKAMYVWGAFEAPKNFETLSYGFFS